MPRFYFHIEDGRRIEDKEGTVLPDVKAARVEAIASGGTMLRDTASYGTAPSGR
jgi:hypothetical protein